MKRIFSTGIRWSAGLLAVLFCGPLPADADPPAAYVKPGVDLGAYTRVMVKPLDLDHIEILKPAWEEDDSKWALEIDDIKLIQELFMDAMEYELETRGGFPLVADSGDGVLRVEVEILSITPFVKPGRTSDGEYVIETLGTGDMVFSAELRDSQTRELLILVEGERPIGDQFRQPTPEGHVKNLKDVFVSWGQKIRESMGGEAD